MEKRRGGITRSERSGEVEVIVAVPVAAMTQVFTATDFILFFLAGE